MIKPNTINMPIPWSYLPVSEEFDKYCIEFEKFWKHKRYFIHKTDSYKNNKRKIAIYASNYLFLEIPYKDVGKNGTSYGFRQNPEGKLMDEETLSKYWREINEDTFFYYQIENIPLN